MPVLAPNDAQRLQSVLDGISDEISASRWGSLDQLRYFCEGADTPLLEGESHSCMDERMIGEDDAPAPGSFKEGAVMVGLARQYELTRF